MTLGWFEGFGIESEYMIVDAATLQVLPIADQILTEMAGELTQEVELGEVAWSNELALHVIEIKGNGPKKDLKALAKEFAQAINQMNQRLAKRGAMLLPTAMHPFFDPHRETQLWPHGNREIYFAYNRIFDCRGHGWSNLQSLHINLPFADDAQFGKLHEAIRLVLPLLPGLAASSPIEEGRPTGKMDTRLFHYRNNQKALPLITGQVVPERVFSQAEYQSKILEPIYQAIAPFDPQAILQDEWLNSRGAIARFERNAIEIRLLDLQECPIRDFSMAALVISVVQALAQQSEPLPALHEADLAAHLWGAAQQGRAYRIQEPRYLKALGLAGEDLSIGEIWQGLWARIQDQPYPHQDFLLEIQSLLQGDSLSARILQGCGPQPNQTAIAQVYQKLGRCLALNQAYAASP